MKFDLSKTAPLNITSLNIAFEKWLPRKFVPINSLPSNKALSNSQYLNFAPRKDTNLKLHSEKFEFIEELFEK